MEALSSDLPPNTDPCREYFSLTGKVFLRFRLRNWRIITSNNTQAQEAKYFDLHTTGIGYLNRIREVPIRRGEPFLAVTVAALHGAADSVEYSTIDCKVVGAQAEKLVRRCKEAVEAEKKVLISFRIGDIWADPFTYEKGEKKASPAQASKAGCSSSPGSKWMAPPSTMRRKKLKKPSKAKANLKVSPQPAEHAEQAAA